MPDRIGRELKARLLIIESRLGRRLRGKDRAAVVFALKRAIRRDFSAQGASLTNDEGPAFDFDPEPGR